MLKWPPSNRVLWFGVLGGGLAWLIQFGVNLMLTFARCNSPSTRYEVPLHGIEIGLSIAAIVVGLASITVAARMFLRTYHMDHQIAAAEMQGKGGAPPTGRINFMAQVGLTVNFLAMVIVIMTGVGTPLLAVCQQS